MTTNAIGIEPTVTGQGPADAGRRDPLETRAEEMMDPNVVWSDPDDTVQDVIAKMQSCHVRHVLVGRDGRIEGLVSNANILGAVSLYLRPRFAQWRRPEDEATLTIKVKWVMSRPVRTVSPQATLATMAGMLGQCGGCCLPVVDGQGGVQGMVTTSDILRRVARARAFAFGAAPVDTGSGPDDAVDAQTLLDP